MTQRKRRIYIDMDGVPVDFDGHFEKVHGVHPKVVGEENFWTVFDTKADGFFRDCPPYEGHLEFLHAIEEVCDHYDYVPEMLTAIPRRSKHPKAEGEKQDWMHINQWGHIKMNIGPYAIDKQKWYRPGDILIDDKDLNVIQWRAKGGIAIHHTPGDFLSSIIQLRQFAHHPDAPRVRFP